ncbi:hypothetical protein B0T26DRAFT_395802 [Lasiosphaeria miniovina]|uniref:Uncharacterized protein n=1 Tax=Lasiosphaeria miniovina TaxID=1954250 RepID=A0AA40A4Q5_9PEZI|nr:uncharacterized protein B0T26DRAFT_395802 [Lasiosphaeria miniovina]KAK0709141.1 hypothetical protein B0T26DRAFT_395802 [Lasiosphaeria miniovina]
MLVIITTTMIDGRTGSMHGNSGGDTDHDCQQPVNQFLSPIPGTRTWAAKDSASVPVPGYREGKGGLALATWLNLGAKWERVEWTLLLVPRLKPKSRGKILQARSAGRHLPVLHRMAGLASVCPVSLTYLSVFLTVCRRQVGPTCNTRLEGGGVVRERHGKHGKHGKDEVMDGCLDECSKPDRPPVPDRPVDLQSVESLSGHWPVALQGGRIVHRPIGQGACLMASFFSGLVW